MVRQPDFGRQIQNISGYAIFQGDILFVNSPFHRPGNLTVQVWHSHSQPSVTNLKRIRRRALPVSLTPDQKQRLFLLTVVSWALQTPQLLRASKRKKFNRNLQALQHFLKNMARLSPDIYLVCPSLGLVNSDTLLTLLKDTFFSVYRKMFAAIFTINLIAFIAFVATNKGSPTLTNVKNATSANLLASVLMRQENSVNLVYEIFTCVPLSTPLIIRSKLAKVFHYGGVHSGCGVAVIVWFILYTALATKELLNGRSGMRTLSIKEGSRSSLYTLGRSRQLS